jgi:hypothetical protein
MERISRIALDGIDGRRKALDQLESALAGGPVRSTGSTGESSGPIA